MNLVLFLQYVKAQTRRHQCQYTNKCCATDTFHHESKWTRYCRIVSVYFLDFTIDTQTKEF